MCPGTKPAKGDPVDTLDPFDSLNDSQNQSRQTVEGPVFHCPSGPSALVPIPVRNSNLWDLFLWLLRQRQRFQVAGASMLPGLRAGDEILVNPRSYRLRKPAIGEVVVLRSPRQPDLKMVKRVIAVADHGACFVQGDNRAQSTDSWTFGWVEPDLILGRVTSRFLPSHEVEL
ncbi:MAG: nickel-type superoxide dismutase maturation protease [Prochlorothrix sp.]|nr:nickel-type superoxide dismutase maturation protease [Prochlorothrix sp.]